MPILSEEHRYKLLKLLHENPEMNQREIASALGLSLGKANFCLKALIEKGMVKIQNFRQSKNKLRYAYLLTPVGVAEKSKLTAVFLRRKLAEHKVLQAEIENLKAEINSSMVDPK
jgi:EPS-associated MarR family transcriptional regulator